MYFFEGGINKNGRHFGLLRLLPNNINHHSWSKESVSPQVSEVQAKNPDRFFFSVAQIWMKLISTVSFFKLYLRYLGGHGLGVNGAYSLLVNSNPPRYYNRKSSAITGSGQFFLTWHESQSPILLPLH